MSIDELEQLIRKYLSTGVAVVVVLVAPGAGGGDARPSESSVAVVEPAGPPALGSPGRGPGGDGSGEEPGESSADGSDRDGSDRDGSDPDGSSSESSSTDGNGPDGNGTDEEPGGEGADEDRFGGGGTGRRSSGEGGDPDAGPGRRGEASGEVGGDVGGESAGDVGGRGTTAAERFGWGAPEREDRFTDGTDGWSIYDGPGHAGNGRRSPEAVSVADGVLTITGDASGTTGGMAWMPGRMYGRWEGRVRAPAADPSYNALLLLWPDAEDFPVGGEIDFMEMMDAERRTTDLFIHYGEDNSQVNGQVQVDGTQWHNWAVEWTPEGITAYVDGEEWYRTTDTGVLPPGPMHLCIQLDWFPEGGDVQESRMEVDWVRQYSLDGGSGAAGDGGGDRDGGRGTGTDAAGGGNGSDDGDGTGGGSSDGSGSERGSADDPRHRDGDGDRGSGTTGASGRDPGAADGDGQGSSAGSGDDDEGDDEGDGSRNGWTEDELRALIRRILAGG